MRKVSFLFWIGQMGLDRFKPPLERGDRLLMNFLNRVDCPAGGLETFGRTYEPADDPGYGAANRACPEMNPQEEVTPKMSSDSRRRSSATSSVSMVISRGCP
jgi:hypothetical protein